MDASALPASDFFEDDEEDFGLNGPPANLEDTNAPADDDAASIDLYGDVADGGKDDFASLYGSEPAPNQHAQAQENEQEQIRAADRDGPSENGKEENQSDAGAAANQSSAGPGPVANRTIAPTGTRGEPSYGTTDAVYIGNLHWWTTDAEIEELCSQYGTVQKIRFFEDKATGKSKGYVLVTFDSPKAAYTCKQGLDGTMVDGKKCVVTFAKQKQDTGKGQGAQRDGTATASTSQGPPGRGAAYRGRAQDHAARGARMRPMGEPQYPGGMGGGGSPGMGWSGGPGMGPFMPPGMMGPVMGPGMGPMGSGMPFMPPGFPPGMQPNMPMGRGPGMQYSRGPMNNYKRPRY